MRNHSTWFIVGIVTCEWTFLIPFTGPFKINGVPLRRVNQAYVIGTSTKVDISGVNVDKFDDKYFAKKVDKKQKKGEGEFFEAEKKVGLYAWDELGLLFIVLCSWTLTLVPKIQEVNVLPQEKKDDQKAVDAPLIKAIEGVAELKAYLGARFSLKAGMKPHELVF